MAIFGETDNNVRLDETIGLQSDDSVFGDAATYFGLLGTPLEIAITGAGTETTDDDLTFTVTDGDTLTYALSKNAAGEDFPTDTGVDYSSDTTGLVDSGIKTIDGETIYLFVSDTDPSLILGRTADGSLALAVHLEMVEDAEGHVLGGQLWTAIYQPIEHPVADETDSLAGKLFVSTSVSTSFQADNVPSGQNLFIMMQGIEDSSRGIVVTGKAPVDQSEGIGITTGDTVNTSKFNETTFGVNNQMVDKGEGLWFTFVTDPVTAYTVPNLDQTEADLESNIQFGSLLEATAGAFSVVQLQGGKTASVQITAIQSAEATEVDGAEFANALAEDTANLATLAVEITTVTVTLLDDTDLTFTGSGTQSGVTATFNADGSVKLDGIKAGYLIEYETTSDHNRVLIENAATTGKTAFDIGGFTITETDSQALEIGSQALFADDAPLLEVSSIQGSGTSDFQIGTWAPTHSTDGDTLTLTLNGYTIGNESYGPLTLTSSGTNADGSTDFSAELEDGTSFTLTLRTDGTYLFDYDTPLASSVTYSTADGTLPPGGPDPAQTLTFADSAQNILFFAVKSDASTASVEALLGDDEAAIEARIAAVTDTGVIGPNLLMNVSGSGIGVGNNVLQGDTDAAFGTADESFVVNPVEENITSIRVYIDNSVGGYAAPTSASIGLKQEALYYTIYYSDGTTSAPILVKSGDLTKAGQLKYFDITAADGMIEAVQLTMAKGSIKIPYMEFEASDPVVVQPISLDFTVTLTDEDGDVATSDFSVSLQTDPDPLAAPDITLNGATGHDDFNVDIASDFTDWIVTQFEIGTDRIILQDPTEAFELSVDGNDAIITVGDTTVRIVDGSGVVAGDIVTAYSSVLITGDDVWGDGTAESLTGGEGSDALHANGADVLTGAAGTDAFVFLTPDSGAVIADFSTEDGDKIIISASGFDLGLETGSVEATLFGKTGSADADDRFILNEGTGALYFDSDGSGSAAGVLITTFDSVPSGFGAGDLLIIA